MPRYMVERTFSDGLHIPVADGGADVWRKTAASNVLPVDRITQVRVLDPYFYV
jgi:hypothetical protein